MNLIKTLLIICSIVLVSSCSSDDTDGTTPNGYNFEGTFYPIEFANVQGSNLSTTRSQATATDQIRINITLTSKDITTVGGVTDVSYLNFEYLTDSFQPETITTMRDYQIFEGIDVNGDSFTGGDTLLDESIPSLKTSNIELKIKSVDETSINLDFTLTRQDGKVFSGHYEGEYSDLN